MITISSAILSLIFLFLSTLHFYWATGGDWALDKVIPTTSAGSKTFGPPLLATIAVALALLSMAVLYIIHAGFVSLPIPEWIITASSWFIPSVFLLRAIGEFKYVGLFKKVKGTNFAKADTKIFVPLCLFISMLGYVVVLLYR